MTASNTPFENGLDEIFTRHNLNGIGQGGLTSAEAKAALKSLFETMCNEIFSESQSDPEIYFGNGEEILRQRIPQVLSKYFDGGRE